MARGLIWAQTPHRELGKDGSMAWYVPEDLKFFRTMTMNNPVIMGRKTWLSLDEAVRPLPGRTNIVLTRSPEWSSPGAVVAHSPQEAFDIAAQHCQQPAGTPLSLDDITHQQHVWVIGGARVYATALPHADFCVITDLQLSVEDADAWAPELSQDQWTQSDATEWQTSSTGIVFRHRLVLPR